jgi:hypothetical protein
MSVDNEVLYTVEALAEKVGFDPKLLYRYIHTSNPKNRLKALKLGHTYRVTFQMYFDWLFSFPAKEKAA